MMKSSNLVILRGNLGADPEMKTLQGGHVVVNLRMATHTWFRGRNGEKVERTDWHRVEAWNKTAEFAQHHLRKGDRVQVMGDLKHDVVSNANGTKTTFTHIRAHELENFTPRAGSPSRAINPAVAEPSGEPARADYSSPGRPSRPQGASSGADRASFTEEDVPF